MRVIRTGIVVALSSLFFCSYEVCTYASDSFLISQPLGVVDEEVPSDEPTIAEESSSTDSQADSDSTNPVENTLDLADSELFTSLQPIPSVKKTWQVVFDWSSGIDRFAGWHAKQLQLGTPPFYKVAFRSVAGTSSILLTTNRNGFFPGIDPKTPEFGPGVKVVWYAPGSATIRRATFSDVHLLDGPLAVGTDKQIGRLLIDDDDGNANGRRWGVFLDNDPTRTDGRAKYPSGVEYPVPPATISETVTVPPVENGKMLELWLHSYCPAPGYVCPTVTNSGESYLRVGKINAELEDADRPGIAVGLTGKKPNSSGWVTKNSPHVAFQVQGVDGGAGMKQISLKGVTNESTFSAQCYAHHHKIWVDRVHAGSCPTRLVRTGWRNFSPEENGIFPVQISATDLVGQTSLGSLAIGVDQKTPQVSEDTNFVQRISRSADKIKGRIVISRYYQFELSGSDKDAGVKNLRARYRHLGASKDDTLSYDGNCRLAKTSKDVDTTFVSFRVCDKKITGWRSTFPGDGIQDGPGKLSFEAQDAADNRQSTPPVELFIDRRAPNKPRKIAVTKTILVKGRRHLAVNWKAPEDPGGANASGVNSYVVTVKRGSEVILAQPVKHVKSLQQKAELVLPDGREFDGTEQLEIIAIDGGRNVSSPESIQLQKTGSQPAAEPWVTFGLDGVIYWYRDLFTKWLHETYARKHAGQPEKPLAELTPDERTAAFTQKLFSPKTPFRVLRRRFQVDEVQNTALSSDGTSINDYVRHGTELASLGVPTDLLISMLLDSKLRGQPACKKPTESFPGGNFPFVPAPALPPDDESKKRQFADKVLINEDGSPANIPVARCQFPSPQLFADYIEQILLHFGPASENPERKAYQETLPRFIDVPAEEVDIPDPDNPGSTLKKTTAAHNIAPIRFIGALNEPDAFSALSSKEAGRLAAIYWLVTQHEIEKHQCPAAESCAAIAGEFSRYIDPERDPVRVRFERQNAVYRAKRKQCKNAVCRQKLESSKPKEPARDSSSYVTEFFQVLRNPGAYLPQELIPVDHSPNIWGIHNYDDVEDAALHVIKLGKRVSTRHAAKKLVKIAPETIFPQLHAFSRRIYTEMKSFPSTDNTNYSFWVTETGVKLARGDIPTSKKTSNGVDQPDATEAAPTLNGNPANQYLAGLLMHLMPLAVSRSHPVKRIYYYGLRANNGQGEPPSFDSFLLDMFDGKPLPAYCGILRLTVTDIPGICNGNPIAPITIKPAPNASPTPFPGDEPWKTHSTH